MDFMALFTMGTGGHYITILHADWSISTETGVRLRDIESENDLEKKT